MPRSQRETVEIEVQYLITINGHKLVLNHETNMVECNHVDCSATTTVGNIECFTIGPECQCGPKGYRYNPNVLKHSPIGSRHTFLRENDHTP
jgi:hypothetical protein